MNKEDFLDDLYNNRSSVFPGTPTNGAFHMDTNGKIYVFLENSWAEVEDIRINLDYSEQKAHDIFDPILKSLGYL